MLTTKYILQRISDGKYYSEEKDFVHELHRAKSFNQKGHAQAAFTNKKFKPGNYQIREVLFQVTETKWKL